MGSTTEVYQNELASRGYGSSESRSRNATWRRNRDYRERDRSRRELDGLLGVGVDTTKPVLWSNAYFVSPGVMYSPTYDKYVTVDASRAGQDLNDGVQ
jgi:hypothetical protein